MVTDNYYNTIVIGGGFFGCYIASKLKRNNNSSVVIIESESELFKRASFNNQARVHKGYHYPRSLLTGLSSGINFKRFITDFKSCIYDDFEQYYAIGKIQSKINTFQFKTFCNRIDAPLKIAPPSIKSLFNQDLIEDVFLAEECAFDAVKLKDIIYNCLKELKVPIFFNTNALGIFPADNHNSSLKVALYDRLTKHKFNIFGRHIFNCTYSNINTILTNSGLTKIHLKQELTETALVKMPGHLRNKGITIMCGPFFSFMPFPPKNLHTLSHVRYTPHHSWYDIDVDINNYDYFSSIPKKTNFFKMLRDAQRYIPSLRECEYIDSLWEIKTILPQSEIDDSRPILFKRDEKNKNIISVMGGKIDNVYDLEDDLGKIL